MNETYIAPLQDTTIQRRYQPVTAKEEGLTGNVKFEIAIHC